jgi:hypothetical protein
MIYLYRVCLEPPEVADSMQKVGVDDLSESLQAWMNQAKRLSIVLVSVR